MFFFNFGGVLIYGLRGIRIISTKHFVSDLYTCTVDSLLVVDEELKGF